MNESTPHASEHQRPREIDATERMSEHEALMWNIEKDPWLNPSGGALFIFDQPIDVDLLRARMRTAVANLPRFTQRVQPGLGRLSTPAWVPDPEFDFNSHFRVMTLSGPGTERQLLDLAAHLYTEPLDRTRPLWRMVVIEGLESGQGALWNLMHHAISDGIGQLRIGEMFQDLERDVPRSPDIDLEGIVARAAAEYRQKEAGGDLGSSLAAAASASVGHVARRVAGTARRAAGEIAMWPADPARVGERVSDVASVVAGTAEQLTHQVEEGEGAPLWRTRSRHRHLESVTVPLDELKAASKAADTTINVAFVAGMADAAARYHADRGASFDTLNMSFVLSTRTDNRAGGNSFTPVLVQLPGGLLEREKRLATTAEILDAARDEASRGGGITALSGVVNLLPTSVVTRTARSQAAKIDLATSNLRGAPFPLYIGGARIERSVTMGPLAGTPCNATALSYCNNFDIGLFIDPVAIEDPGAFRQCVVDAFDVLLA
ncbi:MAG: wax ester/triacylglycerol synthase family O-acyltransferase [Acidimicrobiales bacterium]